MDGSKRCWVLEESGGSCSSPTPPMVTEHPLRACPFLRAWHGPSHVFILAALWQGYEAQRGRAARLRPGARGRGTRVCRGQHGVRGALRAYMACNVQKCAWEGRGHCSWPAGDGPLWPCHVGFARGTGEPQKGFKQGRDKMKCGFTG